MVVFVVINYILTFSARYTISDEKMQLLELPCQNFIPSNCHLSPKVGVISDSHKIADSILRICQNDASKLVPSRYARHDPRLTGALK
jgi:hypothetical protein